MAWNQAISDIKALPTGGYLEEVKKCEKVATDP